MKNKIFLHVVLLTTCTFSCQLFAQIQVANTGNVGIAIADTIEPLSTVSIGSEGLEGAQLSVSGSGNPTGNQYGVVSQLDMNLYDVNMYSIWGKSTGVARTLIGVHGEAIASSGVVIVPGHPHNPIATYTSTYGVYGLAGGSIRDNYGVYGALQVNGGDGAGVFGTTGGGAFLIGGRYAGYFKGQTKVDGNLYARDYLYITDPIMRSADIIDESLSDNLLSLHPIKYQVADSTEQKDRTHYGLDVQEMQKLFPELVHEDGIGNVSVNYVELIPILITFIRELDGEVKSLRNQLETVKNQQ